MDRAALPRGRRDEGQVIVLFVISVFAIIGMVGIVLDGGSAFAQRRSEQNVADLAAMAGATAHLSATGTQAERLAHAEQVAREVATANGFTHDPTQNVTVDVTVATSTLATTVQVNVTKPHRNNFASIFGMSTWPVSVTATAVSSAAPNGAIGAMPLLFNAKAFPGAICDETTTTTCVPEVYQLPGTGNEDVPQDATQFNWTIFCTASGNACNGNSNGVKALIDGMGTSTTVYLDDDIGPLNAGSHTTLFTGLQQHIGKTFPVPVVNDEGEMVGWAYFKLLSTQGASDKVITGYFVSPVNAEQLVIAPGHETASLNTGVFVAKLID
jgi:Flp pilus assembly protein TadG